MLGIVTILLVSWVLLFVSSQQHLTVLGFNHFKLRALQCSVGWLLAGALCAAALLFESWLMAAPWGLNSEAQFDPFIQSIWWDFKSVVTEELLFRGALLWLLVRWLGAGPAIAISALAFGIYHWFSYGIWGQWIAMVVVLVGTGLMGWAWALAMVRSQTILLPVALHFGWNSIHNSVFSKGPLGETLLSRTVNELLDGWVSLLNVLVGMVLAPLLMLLMVKTMPLFGKTHNNPSTAE